MNTSDNLTTTAQLKLSQIPAGFTSLVKEELKKYLLQLNPSVALDPDEIYINVAENAVISSETLTEAFLKRSIHETNLLSNPLADLYLHPDTVSKEDQIKELSAAELKSTVDRLSVALVNVYWQQADALWRSESLLAPLELQPSPMNELLKYLAKSISLTEKVYQIDSAYPNVKQSAVAYFSKKLKRLYNKDIHPSTVKILFFTSQEQDGSMPSSTLNLIDFALNKLKCSSYPSDGVVIRVKIDRDSENTALSVIFQESDLLAIKSSH